MRFNGALAAALATLVGVVSLAVVAWLFNAALSQGGF